MIQNFTFIITAVLLVPCGGRKKYPRIRKQCCYHSSCRICTMYITLS